MSENYGFIYVWYDTLEKMYYIGSHWGYPDDGYICSSRWMLNNFKKRPQDFKRKIVKKIFTNRTDLLLEEQRWIDMIDPLKTVNNNTKNENREQNVKYYNINLNINKNVWHQFPEQIKTIGQKISFSKKGKTIGPCSEETKQKISIANSGKIFTYEHKEKLSKAKKGNKHTEEWKNKNSEMLMQQWATGIRKSNGPISEEHKQKISKKLKGRKLKQDQINLLKENNYKKYLIEFYDETILEIIGLKKFAQDNNIPYVTLHKAFKNQISIPKFKIKSIKTINTCKEPG